MKGSADPRIQVRSLTGRDEYEGMIDYFLNGSESFLKGMGVDSEKLPQREEWLESVLLDHERAPEEKDRAYLGWMYDGHLVGHSSINQIRIGEEAFIHLHLWKSGLRKAGLGTQFFAESAAEFVRLFNLKRLYSEPFSENPAPNHILMKSGFRLVKAYRTTPGPINFEQVVNQYLLEIS